MHFNVVEYYLFTGVWVFSLAAEKVILKILEEQNFKFLADDEKNTHNLIIRDRFQENFQTQEEKYLCWRWWMHAHEHFLQYMRLLLYTRIIGIFITEVS